MPFLTLFTAPKPFINPHIAMIQRNALRSWLALGDAVSVVMIGDEPGIKEAAQELGVMHLPNVDTNANGTPLLSSIFSLARQVNDSPFLAYINADILIMPGFIETIQKIAEQKERFLVVGQRWDMDVRTPLHFDIGWQEDLLQLLKTQGQLHPKAGSDYFVYPRQCFKDIPAFAVGRAGWDNWMIYKARWQGWAVVDATGSIDIVHQNHDYSHLPGGQPHYKLPETDENVRLAGGKHTVFTLDDANYVITKYKVKPINLTWKKFWREVEIFPMVTLKSKTLTNLTQALYHPRETYGNIKRKLIMAAQKGKAE